MKKMRNILSNLNFRLSKRLKQLKINFLQYKEEKKEEQKNQSKIKSFIIGFAALISVFGVTLFNSALPAFAKDIPIRKLGDLPTNL
jgi:hypothetical protein